MATRVLVLLMAFLASPALASDGILEINQTCAVQTGCFVGDGAGLPVTIIAPGSYRLTSNLVVPDADTDGILVSTDDVHIDLAGFAIRGPVVCTGNPVICVPNAGTGSGVRYKTTNLVGIGVRQGSIQGMGASGIQLGAQAEITNMRVRSNRLMGIDVEVASTVVNNTASRNGSDGIQTGAGSTVSGNTVYLNGGSGIFVNVGSTASGNTAYLNGVDGIQASTGSNVESNTAYSNNGFGLHLGSKSGYRGNVTTNNTAGAVSGGVDAGNNVCDGSTTCP